MAAKPAHALPHSASAYTATTTPSMPEAKPGKGLSKPAPKSAAHKPAPAKKPAAKKASAEE